MHARTEALLQRHHIARGAPFLWDLEAATLGVVSQGHEVELGLVCVGTLSHASGTFRWGWANRYLAAASTARMQEVRAYGEAHGLPRLADVEWSAEPDEAFAMMAVAGVVLGAEGMWTDRSGPVTLYFVLNP